MLQSIPQVPEILLLIVRIFTGTYIIFTFIQKTKKSKNEPSKSNDRQDWIFVTLFCIVFVAIILLAVFDPERTILPEFGNLLNWGLILLFLVCIIYYTGKKLLRMISGTIPGE